MTSLFRILGLDSVTQVESVRQWAWQTAASPAAWLVALVIVAGAALALINWLPQLAMRLVIRCAVFCLRLAMFAIILIIMYRVELSVDLEVRKPQVWAVLVDDSGSMNTPDENGRTRYAAAREDMEAVQRRFGKEVQMKTAALSGQPGETAGQGPTHLYQAIRALALEGEPVDQIVLLTDGRDVARHDFSRLGRDLRTAGVGVAVRVYGTAEHTVSAVAIFAEPDTETIRIGEDLIIHGSILSAPADSYAVRLLENGEQVLEASIPRDRRQAFQLTHRPKEAGVHEYTLELLSGFENDDGTPRSNKASFMAQVVPEKINVLLIEGYPRFEFKFTRYVLDSDPMINLVSITHLPGGGVYIQGEPRHSNPEQGLISSQADLFKYDVVVMLDVPRSLFSTGEDQSESRMHLLRSFVTDRGGGLIMGGGRDVYRAGGYQNSPLASIIPFDLSDYYGTAPQFPRMFFATVNQGMQDHPILRLLPDAAQNRERLHSLRQLDGCNNVGRPRPLATTLLSRTIERRDALNLLETITVPVLVHQQFGAGKVVASTVDTFWRWQLQPDFPDDPPLQTLFANMVRYVSPPPGKAGEPQIRLRDRAPQIGSDAVLYTILRDERYRPIRNADILVTAGCPDGRQLRIFPRDLPDRPGYYEYRIPLDIGGRYTVTAAYADKEPQKTSFIAGATRGEFADLRADRESMAELSQAAGGTVVTDIPSWLAQAGRKPATLPSQRTLALWNSPLMLMLFVGFVSLDCYLRKRQGLA